MVLPQPTSRLSLLKNKRNSMNRSQIQQQQQQQQRNMNDYLKKSTLIPHQQQAHRSTTTHSTTTTTTTTTPSKNSILSETQNSSTSSNKILDGVVACLDVRTEDGDDVSQNFERALQSMGAKIRRTFSDSVTHLIFKNGSPATLKKALSKNIFIINLLWISRCKTQGKRVPEKDFIIERPQGLVLAGKKRRKSMEPGKVRALVMNELMQPSLSSSSEGSANDEKESRRKTIATSSWKGRDFSRETTVKRIRHDFEDDEEDPMEGVAAEVKLNPPRLSLPISVESIASRHITKNTKLNNTIIPVHAPSLEKKEQIKARFSIGSSKSTNSNSSTTITDQQATTTTAEESIIPRSPIITASVTTPLKRKRRLTGNLSRPSINSTTDNISFDKLEIIPPKSKPTIVLTSMTISTRNKCEEAIKKLGLFQLASDVTENTTHVLVGAHRRTKSVTLGLLRGAWLLKPEWLFDCEVTKQHVPENEYELSDWYPRAHVARTKTPLFTNKTCIKVISNRDIEFIEELVKLAGGNIVRREEQATIMISDKPIKGYQNVVSDLWLFESIEQWRYLPIKAYAL